MAIFVLAILISAIIQGQVIAIIALSGAAGLLIFPMLLNTKYTINGNTLNIRSGLIVNTDIDISRIKKIVPTNTIFSAPALSFDRIEIFYNTYDSVVISPQNKKEFAETLKQINPAIVTEL